MARALEEEKIVADIRSFKEFESAVNRAAVVKGYLDTSAILATGTDEEAAYRRLVADFRRRPVLAIICWALFTIGGIDIVVGSLYRLGRFLGGGEGLSYSLATVGSIGLTCAILLGARRDSARAATFLATIGLLGAFAWYTSYYKGDSSGLRVTKVVVVILMFSIVLAGAVQHRIRFKNRRRSAYEKWASALYNRGIVPALATLINDLIKGQYSTDLHYRNEFLSRSSPSDRLHQRTPVGYQIAELMDTLKNGSLAIAGPRGAGKSDLMAALCRGSYNQNSKRRDLVVSVSAPVVFQASEFMLDLHGELCDAVIRYVSTHGPGSASRMNRRHRRAGRLYLFWAKHRGLAGWVDVMRRACDRADSIRYSLTIGREVSGRLGLGRSHFSSRRTLSKAEQPSTYPQIVSRLRKDLEYFADRLAVLGNHEGESTPRLVVTIDELGRIQSTEQAVQFVNEIKAIFMVPNCYFLASVSEDALQDFELAAMGARTAIDSAFDEVLWLDYMDFELSKALLKNYVIGLSEQFLSFAYVRSGGLARQLVRCARELINWPQDFDVSIAAVVRSLAASDLRRVSTAVKGSLIKVSNRRAVAALVHVLDDYPVNSLDQAVLVDYANRLIKCNIGDDQNARDLRDTMAAQTLYLATLTRLFSSDLDEDRVKKATNPIMPGASFNALARVRRYLGINPQAALELLSDFRAHWDMVEVNLTPLS